MTIDSTGIVDCSCGHSLGVVDSNVFWQNGSCIMMSLSGGISIITCCTCGAVWLNPALVQKFRSKSKQGETHAGH